MVIVYLNQLNQNFEIFPRGHNLFIMGVFQKFHYPLFLGFKIILDYFFVFGLWNFVGGWIFNLIHIISLFSPSFYNLFIHQIIESCVLFLKYFLTGSVAWNFATVSYKYDGYNVDSEAIQLINLPKIQFNIMSLHNLFQATILIDRPYASNGLSFDICIR